MKEKIQNFADVIPGYAFREAIKPDSAGSLFVLQAGNVDSNDSIKNTNEMVKVTDIIFSDDKYYLKKNDILLVARGMKSGAFRATIFEVEDLNVIASSSVHIIRLKDARILPEYLCLYLNSKDGQDALVQIVSGAYIGVLPRNKILTEIQVPIPPLLNQKSIVDLDKNIKLQEKILERRSQLKKNIINATFRNLTHK